MTKIALVTGGTDGVRRSLVRALFREGYEVHCIGSNADKGDLLARELIKVPRRAVDLHGYFTHCLH